MVDLLFVFLVHLKQYFGVYKHVNFPYNLQCLIDVAIDMTR